MEEGLSNFPKMILKSQDSNLGSLALEDKINTIRYFCTGIMSTALVWNKQGGVWILTPVNY